MVSHDEHGLRYFIQTPSPIKWLMILEETYFITFYTCSSTYNLLDIRHISNLRPTEKCPRKPENLHKIFYYKMQVFIAFRFSIRNVRLLIQINLQPTRTGRMTRIECNLYWRQSSFGKIWLL